MIALFSILSFKHMASADALVTRPNTLIVYSTQSDEVTPAVHMLDLLAYVIFLNRRRLYPMNIWLKRGSMNFSKSFISVK
nr:hypothetical protein [Bacillus pumilus]